MGDKDCTACGICCEMYGATINASECDLERWRAEGREDILAHVGSGGELWVAPGTGEERIEFCPFYQRLGSDSGGCSIHETKPRTCRLYPTELHNWLCVNGARHQPHYS